MVETTIGILKNIKLSPDCNKRIRAVQHIQYLKEYVYYSDSTFKTRTSDSTTQLHRRMPMKPGRVYEEYFLKIGRFKSLSLDFKFKVRWFEGFHLSSLTSE